MFPVFLLNNLIYDLSLSLTGKGVPQGIPEPYSALLPYITHIDPRALDSCQSVGNLNDRKHSSLIWMGTGTKKGLSVGGRISCSVDSVERTSYIQFLQLHLTHYYFWTLPS